jgi:hypothetical protein
MARTMRSSADAQYRRHEVRSLSGRDGSVRVHARIGLPTWGEHLRHHTGRMTEADRQFHDDAAAFAVGPPEVKHLFALSAPGT